MRTVKVLWVKVLRWVATGPTPAEEAMRRARAEALTELRNQIARTNALSAREGVRHDV